MDVAIKALKNEIICIENKHCVEGQYCDACQYEIDDEDFVDVFNFIIPILEKQEAKKPDMIWDTTFGKVRPHCPVCRASNPIGSNYCWNCGQHFTAEEDNDRWRSN